MSPDPVWPRLLVRGHLFGIAAVVLLAAATWILAGGMQERLVQIAAVEATPATNAAAGDTITGLLTLLTIGTLIHAGLNLFLWQALRRQQRSTAILIAAAANLCSMPIGTILGTGVLLRHLQLREAETSNGPPSPSQPERA